MTPELTAYQEKMAAGAEAVTQELGAYADQLVPGAAQVLGQRWHEVGNLPPERRSEEIAKRMAGPLVDKFRDPAYDPQSAAPPLRVALQQQAHKLRDGAVDELAGKWAVELAGRPPARIAAEVARRLNDRSNAQYLKVQPEAPAYENRIYQILSENFRDILTADGIEGLIRDRGREFAPLNNRQIIRTVANAMKAGVNVTKYGTGQKTPAGDLRLEGAPLGGIVTTRSKPADKPVEHFRSRMTEADLSPPPPARRRLSF